MNGINGFFWLLIAFPVYLLANGKFVSYVKLAAIKGSTGQTGGASGSW